MDVERISSLLYREALSHFASGVTVVTARTAEGLVGFTATGFTSASLTPPLILLCVGKVASAHPGIVGSERFGVSVLGDGQEWIAEQFARPGIDRFGDVALRADAVPLIDGALVQLVCRPYARHDAGDHTILLGEVLDGYVGAGRPLVRYARRFGQFVAENAHRPASTAEGVALGGSA